MSDENMEDILTDQISQLPSELKWRILFYLPSHLLLKIGLSNQEAWFIYNSTRCKSKPWDEIIDWVSNITAVTLFAPNALYVFTLSDLHRHSTRNHECFSMSISKGSGVFKLMPFPQYGGFVLMNEECVDVPWSDIPYISKSSSKLFLTNGCIPISSPAYTFLQRELADDHHIQRYLNRWRDPSEISDYEIHDHMLECSDCEWSTDSGSDFSYSPSDLEDDCSSSSSDNDEDTAEVLRFHLDDLKCRISEHEKEELAKIKERAKSTSKKTIYCHNFNNKGSCSYGVQCHFLHEEAPLCWFDKDCARIKCGFYHSGNPKPQIQKPQIQNPISLSTQPKKLLEQVEDLESAIKRLERQNDVPKIDVGNNDLKINEEQDVNGECEEFEILQNSCKVFEDLMLDGDICKEMNRRRGYSFRDRHTVGLLNEVNVSPLKLSEDDVEETICNDITEFNDTDVDHDDDILWKEFAADIISGRTNKQFSKDYQIEKRAHYDMKRKMYLENHEKTYPFPRPWTNKVPSGSNFPILFFFSQHPKKMDRIHILKKQRIENCFVWEVREWKETNDERHSHTGHSNSNSYNSMKLGIAVMSIESCSKPNLSCWLDYDDMRKYPHRSTCIFGSEKLTCIGDFHSSELPITTKKSPKATPAYFNVHISKDGVVGCDQKSDHKAYRDNVRDNEFDDDYDGDDDYDDEYDYYEYYGN